MATRTLEELELELADRKQVLKNLEAEASAIETENVREFIRIQRLIKKSPAFTPAGRQYARVLSHIDKTPAYKLVSVKKNVDQHLEIKEGMLASLTDQVRCLRKIRDQRDENPESDEKETCEKFQAKINKLKEISEEEFGSHLDNTQYAITFAAWMENPDCVDNLLNDEAMEEKAAAYLAKYAEEAEQAKNMEDVDDSETE